MKTPESFIVCIGGVVSEPMTGEELRGLWITGAVEHNTPACRLGDTSWKEVRDFARLQEEASALTVPNDIRSSANHTSQVKVVGFEMSISEMVTFMLKWIIATILAALLIAVPVMVLCAIFVAMLPGKH